MSEQENSEFNKIVSEKVAVELTKIRKREYATILTRVAGYAGIIASVAFGIFKMGVYYGDIKGDITTWNGYGVAIDAHEKEDDSMHKAIWAKLDLHDSILLKTALNQQQRNLLRSYKNDTIQIHQP